MRLCVEPLPLSQNYLCRQVRPCCRHHQHRLWLVITSMLQHWFYRPLHSNFCIGSIATGCRIGADGTRAASGYGGLLLGPFSACVTPSQTAFIVRASPKSKSFRSDHIHNGMKPTFGTPVRRLNSALPGNFCGTTCLNMIPISRAVRLKS